MRMHIYSCQELEVNYECSALEVKSLRAVAEQVLPPKVNCSNQVIPKPIFQTYQDAFQKALVYQAQKNEGLRERGNFNSIE